MKYQLFALGDQAITFQVTDHPPSGEMVGLLAGMKAVLTKEKFPGLLDIVVAYDSLCVLFDRFTMHQHGVKEIDVMVKNSLISAFETARQKTETQVPQEELRIPVCYEPAFAPDLSRVAELHDIGVDDVIRLHQAMPYTVFMIGFLPGFPYMGFVDDRIATPRLAMPRQQVRAGSVGIAGRQTGVYPLDSPGGWNIIGRTPRSLFHPANARPVEVDPGQRVSFYSISMDEFTFLASQ